MFYFDDRKECSLRKRILGERSVVGKVSAVLLMFVWCMCMGSHSVWADSSQRNAYTKLFSVNSGHERELTSIAWYDDLCNKYARFAPKQDRYMYVEREGEKPKRIKVTRSQQFAKSTFFQKLRVEEDNGGVIPEMGMKYDIGDSNLSFNTTLRKNTDWVTAPEWLSSLGVSIDMGKMNVGYAYESGGDMTGEHQHTLSFSMNFDS